MVYEARRSVACRRDLESIFDFLIDAHRNLGASAEGAVDRAARRIAAIEDDIDVLGAAPHQGALRPDIMDGLRWVAKDRAIFYFLVDHSAGRIDLLAVFFGGEDHKARILDRMRVG